MTRVLTWETSEQGRTFHVMSDVATDRGPSWGCKHPHGQPCWKLRDCSLHQSGRSRTQTDKRHVPFEQANICACRRTQHAQCIAQARVRISSIQTCHTAQPQAQIWQQGPLATPETKKKTGNLEATKLGVAHRSCVNPKRQYAGR